MTQSPASTWQPSSWRAFPSVQQPDWPDMADLEVVEKTLAEWPPLVFAGETRDLTDRLADVAEGKRFSAPGR